MIELWMTIAVLYIVMRIAVWQELNRFFPPEDDWMDGDDEN